ncbi:hypothetical protein AC1031_004815 [Aphanomyces cochlioides]|nr:hypothetical protein AC1031_004815 [Aphanomyces cochlioides]
MGITYSVRALRVEPNGELVLHRRYKAYLKKHCPEFAHVRCHITQEAITQGATPAMKAKGKIQSLVFFYDLFYNTLFVSAPEKSIIVQGKALIAIIEGIVNAPSVTTVIGSVVGLAYRHNKYCVKIRYYNATGRILFQTLKECTGDEAWTPKLEHAWLTVYAFMLTAMAPVLFHGNVDPSEEELALAKLGRYMQRLTLRGGIKVKPVARIETALFDAVPPTQCPARDAWTEEG